VVADPQLAARRFWGLSYEEIDSPTQQKVLW